MSGTRTKGGRFGPKNPGKPKGARDRRTIVGIETARALSGRAVECLAALVDSKSPRIAFEASRLVLAYAWGAPRQTLDVTGGVGDLASEIGAALAEVRARRAIAPADVPPVVHALPPAEASVVTTPAIEAGPVAEVSQ